MTHLPFKYSSNIDKRKHIQDLTNAYDVWHENSNLYTNAHRIPDCFLDKKYPAYHAQESADVINADRSKIKFFIIIQESLRFIDNKKPELTIPSLSYLKADCTYIFITGDNFNADDFPIYNGNGEKLSYINIYFPWWIYWLTPVDFSDPTYNYSLTGYNKFYDFYSKKTVDFISLMGTMRPERQYLVRKLYPKLYKKICAVSIADELLGHTEIFDHDFDYTPQQFWGDRSVFKKLSVAHSLPIDLYNQAKLNLVVETQIAYDSVDNFFVTEKTIKSLFTGIPFILYGAKNFLSNLRKIGFKTYSTLWNEDYDSLPTHKERAKAIVKLISNLENFDWQAAIPELERIHYHNLKLLNNRNKIVTPAFLNLEHKIIEIINQVESA